MRHAHRVAVISTVVALAAAGSASGNLIINGGFEQSEPVTGGWPTAFGDWRGDRATVVLDGNAGVSPFAGDGMLRFDAAGWGGGLSSLVSCDVYQLVDLAPWYDLVADGAVARLSVRVNRVAGDENSDSRFGAGIHAMNGSASTFASRAGQWLDYERASLDSDVDPFTWERLDVDFEIPEGSTYLAIWLGAQENVRNDSSNEFDGHFADSVELEIFAVPAPAAFALLLPVGLVASRRRRGS